MQLTMSQYRYQLHSIFID